MNERPFILRPSETQSNSVAMIELVATDTIRAKLDHANSDFVETVKSLNFKFKDYAWLRAIDKFAGPIDDRIIELAYYLLKKNLIVCVPSADYKNRIENAEFADEQTRWITKVISKEKPSEPPKIKISWGKHEDFFQEVRQLIGITMQTRRGTISPRHYEEIYDFAQMWDFAISDEAKELLEETRHECEKEIRVELKPRPTKTFKKVFVNFDNIEIDEDLRDDD